MRSVQQRVRARWSVSAPFTSWETHGRVSLTCLFFDLDRQALLPQVTGQIDPEMVGDMPSRTTGGFETGQILDLEILRKADPAVSMETVARHGCTLMAQALLKQQAAVRSSAGVIVPNRVRTIALVTFNLSDGSSPLADYLGDVSQGTFLPGLEVNL